MIIKKKQKTIKALIVRNFIMTMTTIVFVLLLYLLFINAAYEARVILPANAQKKEWKL